MVPTRHVGAWALRAAFRPASRRWREHGERPRRGFALCLQERLAHVAHGERSCPVGVVAPTPTALLLGPVVTDATRVALGGAILHTAVFRPPIVNRLEADRTELHRSPQPSAGTSPPLSRWNSATPVASGFARPFRYLLSVTRCHRSRMRVAFWPPRRRRSSNARLDRDSPMTRSL